VPFIKGSAEGSAASPDGGDLVREGTAVHTCEWLRGTQPQLCAVRIHGRQKRQDK